MFARIKGTHDYLDLTRFNFITSTTEKHLLAYNFTQIATPILEPIELFKRSLGLETDVVNKEMYTLNTGDNSENICLRPEATASTMRAFLQNPQQLLPWKVFSIGPMFRHERPQKGRYRQFHQISVEVIGSDAIIQDAYFITMLERLFQEKFKLQNYALLINFLGCPADRTAFKEILRAFLKKHITEICATCQVRAEKNVMRIFDCKNPICQEIYKNAPHIADHLCQPCALEWKILQTLLHELSVSFSYTPTLVRGLDYYDKTVFEFTSMELGAQNTFCGGGRYNHLAKQLGNNKEYSALGAAMGIERLILMIEDPLIKGLLQLPAQPPLYTIIPLTPDQQTLALHIADSLHAHGLRCEALIEGDSVKSMMRKADKLATHRCIIIGPDEQAAGTLKIKNMSEGTEQTIKQNELVSLLKNNNFHKIS